MHTSRSSLMVDVRKRSIMVSEWLFVCSACQWQWTGSSDVCICAVCCVLSVVWCCDSEYRFLIPSPKVATYDLAPEMSMTAVGAKVIEAMASGSTSGGRDYPFIMCNLAAPDMVGHTGVYPATVVACEACDVVIGDLWKAAQKYGYVLMITADHGNAEEMLDAETGKPKTSHTTNFIPLIIAPGGGDKQLAGMQMAPRSQYAGLKDVAPTVLSVMGLTTPVEMTGTALMKPVSATAASK